MKQKDTQTVCRRLTTNFTELETKYHQTKQYNISKSRQTSSSWCWERVRDWSRNRDKTVKKTPQDKITITQTENRQTRQKNRHIIRQNMLNLGVFLIELIKNNLNFGLCGVGYQWFHSICPCNGMYNYFRSAKNNELM